MPGKIRRNCLPVLFLMALWTFNNPISLLAQNSYSFFESAESNQSDSTGNFYIAVDNASFFKNNEYKSPVVEGYTLTGAWIRPKAVYYPDPKLRLELGGSVLKYIGRDDYHHLDPWFSAVYLPTPDLSVTLGNLNNDHLHGLIEPVADNESFITNKPENGLQVKYDHRWLMADLWIDWQKMILTGDPFQEKFIFGARTEIYLHQSATTNLSIPISFTGQHLGGEIDQSDATVKTHTAFTAGISGQHLTGSHKISELGASLHYAVSTYPEESILSTRSGNGFYFRSYMGSRWGKLSASFWHSKNFYTPLGHPLFQNASSVNNQASEKNGLLDLQYSLDRKIFGATHFGFVFDYYYDTIREKTSNSAALFLIVNLGILTRKK